MRWDRSEEDFGWTAELSGAGFAPLLHCVPELPGILECTVAILFFMRLIAFAIGCLDGPTVRA